MTLTVDDVRCIRCGCKTPYWVSCVVANAGVDLATLIAEHNADCTFRAEIEAIYSDRKGRFIDATV